MAVVLWTVVPRSKVAVVHPVSVLQRLEVT
jgi:hypothetical protein